MLTVRFENNFDAVEIYRILGVEGEPFGSNFVMYDEKTPVALWRMRIVIENGTDGAVNGGAMPVGIIEKIFFADGVEEGDKTFFLHAMFFKLIEGAPIRLRIEGIKPEFEKFGFTAVDGNMEANSNEINLHYMCGRLHKG